MREVLIDGYYVKNCIDAGYTQHVALMFPGSTNNIPFEVIGDERIAVENGFTLHEYFNQETNITPGSICTTTFESTLLKDDGGLTGFNYERDFMLMLGVEADNASSLISPAAITDYPERIKLNNIWIGIRSGSLLFKYSNTQQKITNSDYKHMFAVEKSTDANNPTYYLFIVSNNGTTKFIDVVYKIESGSGESSQVTVVSNTNLTINDYVYNRLEVLAAAGVCELWKFNGLSSTCKKFTSISNAYTEYRLILYEHMAMLTGEQPRRTLGKVVTFSALGVSAKLDQNADSYANTAWSSARTLATIRKNLLNAVGLDNYSSMPGGSQSFSTNPFMGMKGYTYRELLSYVGEISGRLLKENRRQITSITIDSVPGFVSLDSRFDFSYYFYYNSDANIVKNQYYEYDAEEYSVAPINVIISKQTEEDLGTSYPDSPSGTNTLYFLNNPLLIADDVSVIKSRLSYAYLNMYNTAYHPAVIEMPSRLYIEPGDMVNVTLEDNSTVTVPVFCMTTVWNGAADCTIECTGEKLRDQYKQIDFRKTLKEGAKIHEVIVDIEQSYSRIMDTLTGNYSTTQQTAEMISQEIGDSLGNYYTKTETAQQINTRITNALGDYSTTQQTADAISAYVSNNAYTIKSGVAINANGVEVTGGKYVKIMSGGLFDVDSTNFKLNDTHLQYIGTNYTTEINDSWFKLLNNNSGGGISFGQAIPNDVDTFIAPVGGDLRAGIKRNDSWIYVELTDYYDSGAYGCAFKPGTKGILGTSAKYWDAGYIKDIHYYTLTQHSSIDAKHDIQPLPDVGDLIDKLTPVSYVYNGDETNHKRFGLIHEQTVDIIPEICVGDKYSDAKDKAINYMDLVPILLKEIQSLRARVKDLESKNGQN